MSHRSDRLVAGSERPWTDPQPRCPEHGVTLTQTGLCGSHAGDHHAGDHDRRVSPLCPACAARTATRAAHAADAAAAATADAAWTPTDCLTTIPTERTTS
jgi:hypothetical protein